ncbi:DUF4034 domain-containing protein [Leptolyngbya sp. FACHB-8]|nr:DUF4034 domain-containing protein [Leptolyngbya sp. FACHB-8]MBD1913637.1 DUF4034 domain-containing protein [Leptolyngbya sp. FACHB-8]MBD2155498.1 DUF4034 domain-containing protein [Leptolyngbya sp. FACHB-16]
MNEVSIVRTGIASGIPAATIPCVEVPSSNQLEMTIRLEIASEVANALAAGDFKTLEDYYSLYRQRTSRTPGGRWKLQMFYAGTDFDHPDNKKDIAAFEAQLLQWMQAYPQSPASHIAYSRFLLDRAWQFRGGGYAREVPREAWAPFYKNVELARVHLQQTREFASADPQWYVSMFKVAQAESWSRLEVKKLLREALSKEPYYQETYQAVFDNLSPKWGGSYQEAETFADDAVTITSQCEGQGMYTRIYWRAIDSNTDFIDNPFGSSRVSWEKMKLGFEDIIARYPSAWNINNFARFACLAGDQETTRRLINQIGDKPILEAWTQKTTFADCQAWASQSSQIAKHISPFDLARYER